MVNVLFFVRSLIIACIICIVPVFSLESEFCSDTNTLAPESSFKDFHALFIAACKHYREQSLSGNKRVNIFKTKYRFSIQPNREAWDDLMQVKKALGTPEEYNKPLTSDIYDEIIKLETLQALARAFVSFFPAFDKNGNFTSINRKDLRIIVESLFWSPERRVKAFIDKPSLEKMIKEMDDDLNPGTLGATWSGMTWRRNMMLYKKNILNSTYKKNKVFPLSVFLHELAHALPGYKDTMFNDTLAFAFLAFMGVDIDNINEFDEDLNKMKDIDVSNAKPFVYFEVYDDLKKIVSRTNFVKESGYNRPVQHTFITSANAYRSEPYLMNRHIGTYIGKRFKVVFNKLLEDKRTDVNSAYILAKDDMLETLRIAYEYLINELPKDFYKQIYGSVRQVTVSSFPFSKERIIFNAA